MDDKKYERRMIIILFIAAAILILEAIGLFWTNHPTSVAYAILLDFLPIVLIVTALVILNSGIKESKRLKKELEEVKEKTEKLSNQEQI